MSYLVRTGNLASTPKLQEGENGVYCFARVIVTDRMRDAEGNWADGPAIGYDVAVSGSQARGLVATAEASGNIRVTVAGRYWTEAYEDKTQHKIRADEVAVSLRGQSIVVDRQSN